MARPRRASAPRMWTSASSRGSIEQLGDVTVQEITREVIDELRALAKPRSSPKSTADRYMALLRSILKKCADDWGTLDKAPKVPMYRPEAPEPRWLTHAEFARLEKKLPAAPESRRYLRGAHRPADAGDAVPDLGPGRSGQGPPPGWPGPT
jgi:integrase